MASNAVIIIPARYQSSRFPGKPLANILGKPMLYHVWNACIQVPEVLDVLIATDHPEIAETMKSFGAKVCMSPPELNSGTERCAHVWQHYKAEYPEVRWVINIQGDEPAIQPGVISDFIRKGRLGDEEIFSAYCVQSEKDDVFFSPEVVKVVCDRRGKAMYFSRSPIPHVRGEIPPKRWRRHIGIYAFRSSHMDKILNTGPSELSQAENLEQLTWLSAGYRMHMVELPHFGPAVDRPEDIMDVEQWMQKS